MSHTSRSVEKYSNCKSLFNKLDADFKTKFNTKYFENKDVCAIGISFERDDRIPLHFYYVYGNSTIVVVLDDDVRLITANNIETAFIQIVNNVEEWDKRNKLL